MPRPSPSFIDFTPGKTAGKPFISQRTLTRAIEKKMRELIRREIAFLKSDIDHKIEQSFFRKMSHELKTRVPRLPEPRIKGFSNRVRKIYG